MIEEFSGLPEKIGSEEGRLMDEYLQPMDIKVSALKNNLGTCDEYTDALLIQSYVYEARDLAQDAG